MASEMQAVTKIYDVLKWLTPQVSKINIVVMYVMTF